MTILELLILALIQGITEFIPVSSSAHLILPSALIDGFEDQGAMIDVAAHVGTLAAVMLYFRKDVGEMVVGLKDFAEQRPSAERQLFEVLVIATIPILVVGAAIAFFDVADVLRNPVIIGLASIVFGLVLYVADKRPELVTGNVTSSRQALVIGLAQCLALIPGTSRSGITITASRYLGYTRKEAARFSMLLAIPTISAFGLYAFLDLMSADQKGDLAAGLVIAVLSFIAALITISVFLKATERFSFAPFVIYRVLLGLAVLVLVI
ncbi:MAG: undecaprenyl-diphosphate phosphatase [Pseudomonadota bacterium]